MTRRAGPRIGYLDSLAARPAGESLRPPHRLFGPVFTDPPAAVPPARPGRAPRGYPDPADPAAARRSGTPLPGHHPAAVEDTGPGDPGGLAGPPGLPGAGIPAAQDGPAGPGRPATPAGPRSPAGPHRDAGPHGTAGLRSPADPATAGHAGSGEQGGSAVAPARRASGRSGRHPATQAGRPDFGTLLSAGLTSASAVSAPPHRDQPGFPPHGESGAAAGPPPAPGSVTPPRHEHDPAPLPYATAPRAAARLPHGAAASAGLLPPGSVGPAAVGRQAPGPDVGQEGPAGPPGTRPPFADTGRPYLSPPAQAITGRSALDTAPKSAATLSIGAIEVTVLPPPPAAAPLAPARPAAARPSRPQPPPRLSRGYGPGFGLGQG